MGLFSNFWLKYSDFVNLLDQFWSQHFWNILISIFIFGFVWEIKLWLQRPKNAPPGPLGLPIIGSAVSLLDRSEVQLMKMGWKYGPVIGIKLFNEFTVILNSYEAIHEALVKQGNKFAGRPKSVMFHAFTGGHGIIATDGRVWKENRKFAMATLRKLGVGKKSMESKIVPILVHGVGNILCEIAFGQRFEYDDKKFIKNASTMTDWFAENSNTFMLLVFAPFLRFIPPFNFLVGNLMTSRNKLYEFLSEFIEEHKKTYDNYDARDMIDCFLKKIYENKDDLKTTYTETELLGLIRDFFIAATDTTSNTLRWLIIYLVNRPRVQKKIQREIDRVIGADSYPKMSHLEKMHYTAATMWELFRIRTPGPLAVAHRCIEESNLCGYTIPQNTQVLVNLWAIHHDPKLWEEPEIFKPERFLNDKGEFVKPTNIIPFSIGSRSCIGENLGKMEYFLFLATILQKFHLKPVSPDALPLSEDPYISGQFLIGRPFEIRITERFSRQQSIKDYQQSLWEDIK